MTPTRRVMLWMWVAVVVAAGAGAVPRERDGRSLTWAQVARDDNGGHDFTEYDDSFFRNHDYEYVDDAQEVELSPLPGPGASPPRAERRTLGTLLGRLVPDEAPQGNRPARSSITTTTRPPASFLESMVRTIDNLVVEDLKGWSKFLTHMNTRYVTTTTTTTTPRPAALSQQLHGDLVVVSDESGRQHVVTINDIVSSLAQLDERTITDLLLGPSNAVHPTQPVQIPARPSVSIPIGLDLNKAFTQAGLSSQTQPRSPATSINPNPAKTTSNLSATSSDTSPSRSPTLGPINPARGPAIPSPVPTTSNSGPTNPNRSPTTSNQDPTTSSRSPATSDRSPATSNLGPTSSLRNPTTSNRNPTTSNRNPTTSNRNPTTSNRNPTTSNLSPTTSHRTSSITTTSSSSSSSSSSSGRSPTTSSQSPNQTPTNSNRSPINPSTSSSPPRRHPTLIPDQSPVRGTNTRSRTRHPAHAPPRTHTSTGVSTSSIVRAIPKHASTHTSSQGVTRAVSTRLPSQSMARGSPIPTPTRPSTSIPDFIVPSPSGSTQNAVRRSSQGVQRPARHTGPVQAAAAVPEEESEMIVVRDETGAMHVVTIQDIVSSLTSLNPTEAKGLLFGETPAAPPASPVMPLSSHNLLQNTGHFASGVSASHDAQVGTLGSGGGPVVKTDSAGIVHESPQRGGLFTIQDIIAAAEAEGPQVPRPAPPSQLLQVYPNTLHNVLAPITTTTTTPPSLMDALRQQDLPEPLVQYLAAPSVIQPVTKASPPPQPAPQGLGATISGLFSRIVGGQPQLQQQQPQEQQAQQSQTVVSQAGLALPTPIHFREGSKQSTNTVQGPTKPAYDDFLPPALSHLSQAVQDALRRQADDVPNFVPPGAQPQAAARVDAGPVEFISAEEEEEEEDEPLHAAPQEQAPVILPPSVLEKVPPTVLRRVTKQYLESQVDSQATAEERISKKKKKPHYQYVELHQPVHHSYPPHIPAYPPHIPAHPAPAYPHHHQGYEDDHSGYGDGFPMLDIFLLADVTKVKKIGDSNLSVKAPKIGDPSYFVDTRPDYGYHGHRR